MQGLLGRALRKRRLGARLCLWEIYMNRALKILALLSVSAGLTLTAAGCNRASANKASLSSNWYYDADFGRIQTTFMGEENAEKFTYGVKFVPSATALYKMECADGVYNTLFYAKKLTVSDLHLFTDTQNETWSAQYTEALKDGGYLYYYATELSVPSVSFTVDGVKKDAGEMHVSTENYFMAVDSYLSPVYTLRTVKSPEPVQYRPVSAENCYYYVDREYKSYYNIYGNEVKTVITDNTLQDNKVSEYTLGGLNGGFSLFDRSYLDIVARAVKNKFNSQTVSIYTPSIPARDYTLAGTDKKLSDDETEYGQLLTKFEDLLAQKGLFTHEDIKAEDGTTSPKRLNVAAVSVTLNGGEYSGVSQTYWFAGLENGKNVSRSVMLKYSEPVAFDLGNYEYVLNSIDNMPA